jgi:hypothetical protein
VKSKNRRQDSVFSSLRSTASGWSVVLTTRIRAILIVISAIPAAALAILAIVLAPSIFDAYVSDIVFWVVLIATQIGVLIAAGTINYRMIAKASEHASWWQRYVGRFSKKPRRISINRRRVALVWIEGIVLVLLLAHVGLHITNPYAKLSIVQQPYITSVKNGAISVDKRFQLHAASGPLAEALGYYKSGFLIVQNAWFGSFPAPSQSTEGIIDDIHALRFDPTKPYLISGDQFSVLYPRNLGVFYNSLLDYRTAHSQQDWENRQRIYLQSALYALDAFSSARQITTTIVPISPRSVVLTEVHPGSVASDSLYGVLYAFDQLEHAQNVQTGVATRQIIRERKSDLNTLLDIYLGDVRDPSTGLVKRGVDLAAARDGVVRDSSFYDNVVLWKTLDLADKLGIRRADAGELAALRTKIMNTFWQEDKGYFRDDQTTTNYSSDWLIAMPTGFLSLDDSNDVAKLERMIGYTKAQHLDQPFPIRYSASNDNKNIPFAVKKFVPNYGGDAIWSYWGSQYIYLLAAMYHHTDNQTYKTDAEHFIQIYRDKIEQTRGFPETFDTQGNFLQSAVYKSIRQTGWVVQFEQAEAELGKLSKQE